ncbi:hypothetical protein H1P_90024 [Hyella patelloides LEGE 07179]|uniref:S-layer family protein n=1 Tax=Hyella patelloides LEGE 07179 TaxID=945734 RepID=A0A563W552_9CYAN|nr:hypothetical protein H1P_90024 [Hyella patelloides LEGE 07179]
MGNAEGVTIDTDNLIVTGGGYIDASTFGQGDAGLIDISAQDVTFSGRNSHNFPSSAFSQVNPTGVGNAGGVSIATDNLTLSNGGLISTNTLGQGDSGDVRIFTNQLTMENGGRIESSFFDSTNRIETEAEGTGQPGNINIEANSIDLNESAINAETQSQSSNGVSGIINLQVAEELTLRNNSLISAQALGNADGGNVSINSEFIIAYPSNGNGNGNDILASAEQGNGGNIEISTQGIFGLEERNSTPENQTNDIDASSEFGLSGTVEIEILEVDPSQDSLNIPTVPVETEVAQICEPNSDGNQSEFLVTGRGGLPDSPEANLNGDFGLEDWRVGEEDSLNSASSSDERLLRAEDENSEPIVEADSWIVNDQGNVVLVANHAPVTKSELAQQSSNCQAK